jgi:undecaprenyl-diphosphatase
MVSCCFFGVLAAILAAREPSRLKRIAVFAAAAILVALMGFSRVYLGFHYPTDVLAGYAAAVVWLAVVRTAYPVFTKPPST